MKKFILFLSLILSGIYLANFIGAIIVTKNSGEVLDNSTWTNISSLTNKIDVSSSDIKLNGKLYVTGKLCNNSGNCLGDVKKGLTSDNPGLSCLDVQSSGVTQNGIYWIKPNSNAAYQVYCNMTFDDGGWTLVHVGETTTYGQEFKGDGSCTQLNQHCNYKVNNTLVDASDEVLFHTDSNYWAKLNYDKTGKWALAMKDDASRGGSRTNAGLTILDKGTNVSRDEFWNQFRDNNSGIIFSDDSHGGVMALSYGTRNNGWMQDGPTNSSTHTINVFIRKGTPKIGTENNPGTSCKNILDTEPSYLNQDKTYWIDPDGSGGNAAFEVYCDMTTDGGGRTRYVNILGNYTFANAKDCWQKSDGPATNYTNLECFNPNRYNMAANNIMLKTGGQNYFEALNGLIETNVEEITSPGIHCKGHSDYMTIAIEGVTPTYDNTTMIWLGYSYCNPGLVGDKREVGGMVGNAGYWSDQHYMSYSHSGFGPPPGTWKVNTEPTEFYIK